MRDYKFGKGKHSSLTKATYDAVGDKFRSLWGKEAGWAHSVLFTADLRAFSERLVPVVKKDEEVVKEEVVKAEENLEHGASENAPRTPARKVTKRKKEVVLVPVKVELETGNLLPADENEAPVEDMMSRVKRRRRAKA